MGRPVKQIAFAGTADIVGQRVGAKRHPMTSFAKQSWPRHIDF
jgi:hypothetical protein